MDVTTHNIITFIYICRYIVSINEIKRCKGVSHVLKKENNNNYSAKFMHVANFAKAAMD